MEIPTDLFGLIREYSSPLYPKYLSQCEEALEVMKIYNWDELKTKLKTRHATKVMNSLMAMKAAYLAREEIWRSYGNCPEMEAAKKLYERRHLETMAAVFGNYYLTGPNYASLCV